MPISMRAVVNIDIAAEKRRQVKGCMFRLSQPYQLTSPINGQEFRKFAAGIRNRNGAQIEIMNPN
jgi:hypothetical protein